MAPTLSTLEDHIPKIVEKKRMPTDKTKKVWLAYATFEIV
jgi:hypothetical protein